jgi:7-keto-8-aminopelargonate synthetase-like enzyme
VPVILGNSAHALMSAQMLFQQGINVLPILHPAVEEERARLRFFITAVHTADQIRRTVAMTAEVLALLDPKYVQHKAI